MELVHRFRTTFLVTVVVVASTVIGSGAVNAQEEGVTEEQFRTAQDMSGQGQFLALTAATAMAWDDTSGYNSVEASRAAIGHGDVVSSYTPTGHEAGAAISLSWDATSSYGSVEASRAAASALFAPVAGPSWDDTSGYGAVEASRAEMALDGALADC